MGGHAFTTDVIKGDSAREAYDRVVADARHEFGSDGYNGTISTTSGFHQDVRTPLTAAAANLHAERDWENTQKWENAVAIPVAGDEHFTFRTVKFTVTVDTADAHGKPRIVRDYELREAALAEAFAQYGNAVHSVAVTPAIKTKTVVVNATGRAVTRYELSGAYGQTPLFETRAQAVAAAKKLIDAFNGIDTVSIRAVKFFPETGSADAAVVRTETVSAKGAVTVTLAAPKKPGATPVEGWIFYGTAAC